METEKEKAFYHLERLRTDKAILEFQINEYKKTYQSVYEQISSLRKQERELISTLNEKMDRLQELAEKIDEAIYENNKKYKDEAVGKHEYEWRNPNGSTTD